MQKSTKLLIAIILSAVAVLIYKQIDTVRRLEISLDTLKKKVSLTREYTPGPCRFASQAPKNWGAVQTELRDAVVQVFSDVTEFNWIEPYKSPNQYQSTGSGFFSNETGELITNAHVVDQAKSVSIQIPSFGKRRFVVKVLGVSPERDLALLRLKPEDVDEIGKVLGRIPVMALGNSDQVHRSDEIMALGFPLGQQMLKSTTGIVSGREHLAGQHMIQISAPINPGSSGGPSINCSGQVIGVNSAGIMAAQNVGYIIPSNEVVLFLNQLKQVSVEGEKKIKFLRKPYLGVIFNPASDSLTRFLGNPLPGGLYVAEAQKGSPLEKAGIKTGDMIYEIDGNRLDMFGEMNAAWSEDKISVVDYVSRLMIGDQVRLVIYRAGKERTITLTFGSSELAPVRAMYPSYEKIDYETVGGLVVMQLALNHLPLLIQAAPELTQYATELQNQRLEGALIVTHVLPTSVAGRARTLRTGYILKEINSVPVKTLDELRAALRKSLNTRFLTIKTSKNLFAVLPFDNILKEEEKLAADFFYSVTPFMQEMIGKTHKSTVDQKDESQKAS